MIGHDSKRVKEDDESYEEDEQLRRQKLNQAQQEGSKGIEEGPLL